MQIQPRKRFAATIDSSGNIVVGTAEAGYAAAPSGSYFYLLEKAGLWELGYVDAPLSGMKRRPFTNSGANFANSETGLICTLVDHPLALATVTPGSGGTGDSPVVQDSAYESIAMGVSAAIGGNSIKSVAIGGNATVANDAPSSTAIGYEARTKGKYDTALGVKAETANGKKGGAALGAWALTANSGEVCLGSGLVPHMTYLPITFESVSGGGTFTARVYTGEWDYGSPTDTLSAIIPYQVGANYLQAHYRVQGTVYFEADNAADVKVINVDVMWSNSAVLFSNMTTAFTGANNRAYVLSLNGSGLLQLVTPAVTGLLVNGLLQITKIIRP